MISGIIGKVLASSLIFGTIGGGSYGVLVALSKSSDNSNTKNITRQLALKNEVDEVFGNTQKENKTITEEVTVVNKFEEKNLEEQNTKEDVESKNYLLLGVIWGRRDSKTFKQKNECFFLNGNNSNISIPDLKQKINENSWNLESNKYCEQLNKKTWSNNRELRDHHEEAFWVGGDREKVREVIQKNLEGLLKDGGFKKSPEAKPHESLLHFKDLLSDSCSEVTEGENDPIVEVSCIKKKDDETLKLNISEEDSSIEFQE